MESSNNIIHPTRPKGLGFGSSCFGRVMMSVRQYGEITPHMQLATYETQHTLLIGSRGDAILWPGHCDRYAELQVD